MGWLSFRRSSNTHEHNNNSYCLAGEDNFPGICLEPGNPFRTASSYDCSVDINILKFGSRVYGFYLVGERVAQKVRGFKVERFIFQHSSPPPAIFSLNFQWVVLWFEQMKLLSSIQIFRITVPISHFPFPGFLLFCFIEGSLSRLLGFLSFVLTVLSLPF